MSFRSLFSLKKEREEAPNDFAPFTGVGTLMMSNITGFTPPLREGMHVEELIPVISRFVDLQAEAVHATGGVFLSFSGDISVAFWHPSHVNPSHAAQAFACGQRILRKVRRHQADQKVSPDLRVALATGAMTFANVGVMQIIGRARATAERLIDLNLPPSSSMLCTSETLQLITNAETPSKLVAQLQRSYGEPVDVYEFVAKDAEPD